MTGIVSIIVAIIIFGLLILTHELGHFLAAKACKIGVIEFSIGFGPRLISFEKGGTRYCLKAIPLGGSCRMVGEDAAGGGEIDIDIVSGEDDNAEDSIEQSNSFRNKSVIARMFVVIAGPFSNFLFAFILGIVITCMAGTDPAYIAGPVEGSAAEQAGIKEGDIITSINGAPIYLRADIEMYKYTHDISGSEITLGINRDGKDITISYSVEDKLGVYLGYKYIAPTFGEAIAGGYHEIRYNIKAVVYSLKMLLTREASISDLSGPVGIVGVISDTITESSKDGIRYVFMNVINLSILLAANLGFVNMIPFPALDGGRFLLLCIEGITRKRLSAKVEGIVNLCGFAMLMMLMILVLFNDVFKLFS